MENILYINSATDVRIKEMVETIPSKDKELSNLIILTILSAGSGEITSVFLKDDGEVSLTSIDEIGTKFILDGKEITSENFLLIEGKVSYFGLLFEDSNEHTLKVSLINSSINQSTFENNEYLTKVTIGVSITSIGNSAFSGCSGLTSIVVESGNTKYDSRNNCNAIIETATNTLIVGCKNSVIPNSVTSIGYEAFYSCRGLTSVTIPNSVTTIGWGAFAYCSGLTQVTIGNSVTSIGNSAFEGCSGLTSITSLAKVAPTISATAFNSINSGGTLHVPPRSNYSEWMSTSNYYLGKYNWTKVEDA